MKPDIIEAKLEKDLCKNKTRYFFSLLSPRFDIMNKLMTSSLERRFGGKFKAIRILSARPNKYYAYGNYIVLNNHASLVEKKLKDKIIYQQEYEDLNIEFLKSSSIKDISSKLLRKQDKIFVYPFTTSFMKPRNGLVVIGPDFELATYYDSKIKHHELFKHLKLPSNKVRLFKTKNDLIKNYQKFLPGYISAAYTSGGYESMLVYDESMLTKFLGGLREVNNKGSFLSAKIFEKITWAPNISAIIVDENKTKILIVSDQILSGNRYVGNIYPTSVSEKVCKEIVRITEKVGNYLSTKGYRGLFGLDFLVNCDEKVIVVDLNPRRQGGYACNALALKYSGIELTDLELTCALKEDVGKILAYKNIKYPYVLAHSKIKPSDPGKRMKEETEKGDIEKIFKNKGTFVTTFFRKNSLFIAGYVGFTAVVRRSRKRAIEELILSSSIVLKE